MNILSIEASAKTAAVSVMQDGVIVAEMSANSGLTHSQTLMPMVEMVIEAAGIRKEEVDIIAFTNGPGSFTGLRIGAATAKGLALGWNKPIMQLSTLDVLAQNGNLFDGLVVPVMDARRSQVYTAVYQGGKEILEPSAIPAAELVTFLSQQEGKILLIGDTNVVEKEAAPIRDRLILAPSHLNQIRAAAACELAQQKLYAGEQPTPSDAVEVEYLRKPQAEREYEEKHRQ